MSSRHLKKLENDLNLNLLNDMRLEIKEESDVENLSEKSKKKLNCFDLVRIFIKYFILQ
jgi:hypothetical protein